MSETGDATETRVRGEQYALSVMEDMCDTTEECEAAPSRREARTWVASRLARTSWLSRTRGDLGIGSAAESLETCVDQAARRSRLRRRSTLARPSPWRL